MAIIRAPGDQETKVLPGDETLPEEEQTIVVLKVLTVAERQAITRKAIQAAKSTSEAKVDYCYRYILGKAVKDIRNLRIANGAGELDELEYVVEDDGLVAQECYTKLQPIVEDIATLIAQTGKVDTAEQKNY